MSASSSPRPSLRRRALSALTLSAFLANVIGVTIAPIPIALAAAGSWPTAWQPLYSLDAATSTYVTIKDTEGEGGVTTVQDIASGAGTQASAFLASDSTNLFFRVRLAGDPTAARAGGFTNSFYQAFISNSAGTLQGVVGLDGSGGSAAQPDSVYIFKAGDASATAVYSTATAAGTDTVEGTRVTSVVTGGVTQYYLDYQVPWATFTSVTGLTSSSVVRVYFGTSSSGGTRTATAPAKDWMLGGANTMLFTDLQDLVVSPAAASYTRTSFTTTSGTNPPTAGSATTYRAAYYVLNTGGNTLSGTVTLPVPSARASGISATAGASSGTASYSAVTGNVTWTLPTLAYNQGATLTVDVTITPVAGDVGGTITVVGASTLSGTDGVTGGSVSASLGASATGTVVSGNTAPVCTNGAGSTNEDVALSSSVSCTDANGDSLTYARVANAANGSVTVNSNGSFTYTPNANWSGTDSFTYKANDGVVDSNTVTYTITVAAVNDAPVCAAASSSTNEDTALSSSVSCTDVEGSGLTYARVANATNGSVTVNANGTFTYTPNANYNGTDSFTFKANDGSLDSNTATFTVSVGGVNDAPVCADSSRSTNEDTKLSSSVSCTDVDGDPLTYIDGAPAHGTLSLSSNGSFDYTPDKDWNGSDSFTFRASDGTASSNLATVTVTVSAVNDAPVCAAGSASTGANAQLTGSITTCSDVDSASLTFAATSSPAHGTLSASISSIGTDGSFTYTPTTNYVGYDSFSFTASDGSLTSAPATFTIAVGLTNVAPVCADGTLSLDEDTLGGGAFDCSDANPDDVLGFTIVSGPAHGWLEDHGDGTFTYHPDENYYGADAFVFQASDGFLTSAQTTVSITVSGVNDAPVCSGSSTSVDEDGSVSGDVACFDLEGDDLTYALASGAGFGMLDLASGGAFTYTPDGDYNGPDSFSFVANDGSADSDAATVSISVNPVNDAPACEAVPFATDEDVRLEDAVSCTDVDGDTLTYEVVGAPTLGDLTLGGDGSFAYTPDENHFGSDAFTFRATDGTAASGTATATITIDPVNDAPVCVPGSSSANEDEIQTGSFDCFDVEGDALSYSISYQPAHGDVEIMGAGYSYTPDAKWHGVDAFTYAASDGSLSSSDTPIMLTVVSVNEAPTCSPVELLGDEDAIATDVADCTDGDGDAMTYALVAGAAHGTATVAENGAVSFAPDADWSGTDSFTYAATDPFSATSTAATVTVTVAPVNDAPRCTTTERTASVNEDAQTSGGSDCYDIEGDPLAYTITTQPAHGALDIDESTGDWTYTPFADYNGADSFGITVSDGELDGPEATVSMTVVPVNDAPVCEMAGVTIDEDSLFGGDYSCADTDEDGLTYRIDLPAEHGTASIDPATGALGYTPDANWSGSDAFTIIASDSVAESDPALFTVSVIAVNDAPVCDDGRLTLTQGSTSGGGMLGCSDVDGDMLTASVSTPASHGLAELDGFAYTYTPDPSYYGPDSFGLTASDGKLSSNEATITVAIEGLTPTCSSIDVNAFSGVAQGNLTEAGVCVEPNGLPLTYTLVSDVTHGTLTLGTNGHVDYLADEGYVGDDSFRFYAASDNGTSETVTLTLHVVFPGPECTGDIFETPFRTAYEGSLADLCVSALPGGSVTYAIGENAPPLHGTLDLAPDGSFTYTPDRSYAGADEISIVADGGGFETTEFMIKFMVADRLRPTCENASVTIDEDTSTGGTLSCALNLPDPSEAYFVIGTGAEHGAVSYNSGSGDWFYYPDPDWHGEDSFSLAIVVEGWYSDRATITVTVNPVNDAPVCADETISLDEDGSVETTIGCSDADGDPISYTITSAPEYGFFDFDSGWFYYGPQGDFHGDDAFTYEASDGTTTSTATVTLRVRSVDDAPVCEASPFTTAEDTELWDYLSCSDADGDQLQYFILFGASHGTAGASEADGQFGYMPNPNFSGEDAFYVAAYDPAHDAWSNLATISVTVTPVNDAPSCILTSETAGVPEDSSIGILVGNLFGCTDVEGDPITYTLSSGPDHGFGYFITPWQFNYIPIPDYNGQDTIVFATSDGSDTGPALTLTIDVYPMNDAPTCSGANVTIDEDTTATGTANCADIDNDSLAFRVSSPSEYGEASIDPATGEWSFTPNANWYGQTSFGITANDGTEDSVEQHIVVTVESVNDAPVCVLDSIDTDEDTPITAPFACSDADFDQLTFAIDTEPTYGSIAGNFATGSYTYYPNDNWSGFDSFTVTASDGALASAPATVNVSVAPVNDAPYCLTDFPGTNEDTDLVGTLACVDPDLGGARSYRLTLAPEHGSVSIDEVGGYTYTPAANYNGLDAFSFVANDGTTDSNEATIYIYIVPVNDAPTCESFMTDRTMSEDSVVTLNDLTTSFGCSDVDGDPVSFRQAFPPANGSIEFPSPTSVSYAPYRNWSGFDYFGLYATDGGATSDQLYVIFTVEPINDAPTCPALRSEGTDEDLAAGGNVGCTDVEGDAISYAITTPGSHGTATVDETSGDWTYTPDANYAGLDYFVVAASDGAATSEITVAMNVNPINDPATCSLTGFSVAQDGLYPGSLDCSDADGDTFAVTVTVEPAHGNFTYDADGSFGYVPATGFYGEDSFVYTITDGTETSSELSVAITVAPTPPSCDATYATGLVFDGAFSGSLAGRCAEPNALPLAYELVSDAAHGAVTLDPTGPFSYTASAGWTADDTFVVRATSSSGASGSMTVTLVADPGPPTDLVITPGPSSFTVTYKKPANANDGLLCGYTTHFRVKGTPEWTPNDTDQDCDGVTALTSTISVSNGVIYEIGVAAVTPYGVGSYATGESITYDKPGTPGSFAVAPAGAGELLASWTTPSSGGGTLSYLVEWSTDGETWQSATTSASSYRIPGLADGTSYFVRVTAYNGAIYSDPSETLTVSTRPALTVSVTAGIRSLRLVTGIAGGGSADGIVRYRISYSANGTTWASIATTNTTYTLGNLADDTAYAVTVKAEYAGGTFGPTLTTGGSTLALGIPTVSSTGSLRMVGSSWAMPDGLASNALVTRYDLEYSTNSGSSWSRVSVSGTSRLVSALPDNTTVLVRVRPIYGTIAGGYSANASARTLALATPSVVGTGLVRAISTSWSMPVAAEANGLVARYVVTWTPSGGTPTSTTQTATSRLISGLADATSYSVSVAARYSATLMGATVTADGTPASLSLATLTLAAPAISSVSSGNRTLTVGFAMPVSDPANAYVTSYQVEYATGGGAYTTVSTSATSRTLTGLLDGTTYAIRVRALYGTIAGPYSGVSSAMTLPAPVISSLVPGVSTATVAYAAPSDPSLPAVSAYSVEWSTNGGTSYLTARTADVSRVITGLTPSASLMVRVRAIYGTITGPASAVSSTTTLAAATPTISVSSVGNRSASLAWTMPADAPGNAFVTGYRFEYQLAGALSWSSVSLTATSRLQTGLKNGLTYSFRVRPVYGTYLGTASGAVSAIPVPSPITYSLTSSYYGTVVFRVTATDTTSGASWVACEETTTRTLLMAQTLATQSFSCSPDASTMTALAAGHSVSAVRRVAFDRYTQAGTHLSPSITETTFASTWIP